MTSIRRLTDEDITVARDLLAQLGYHLDVREVSRRYRAVIKSDDHALLAAERAGRVIALCHVYARPALDKPPEAIVQALVVDQTYRGSGTGKAMMAVAEAWAIERGLTSVALTSHVARADAHRFYEKLGYQLVATSHLFRKVLG